MKQLEKLARIAKQLEPNTQQRLLIRDAVVQHTEKFLNSLYTRTAYAALNKSESLLNENFDEEGENVHSIISKVSTQIELDGINAASGFDMGYVPGGGVYSASLGDYWADITNLYAGIFYANPGAVRLENKLILWMAELVGYPSTACGNLTSGGSIANLTAIITARESRQLKAQDIAKYTIYLGEQTHHCVSKALKMAGLGEMLIRYIGIDAESKMMPLILEKQIQIDEEMGFIPWMIVASAGTTDTGAVDPLRMIGELAQRKNIWYHIDAAYGGFFLLTQTGKKLLEGIELSDSVVMDPHKSLFMPYGSGVVIIKNGNSMKEAFSDTAHYFQDFEPNELDFSPADLSIELTKPFRGLRMWLPLKIHGLAPFRAALDEKLILAQYFYTQIKAKGFETSNPPQLTITTFRFKFGRDENKLNKALIKSIQEEGKIYLSSTTLKGIFVIRLCILVFRTHKREVDIAIEVIEKHKNRLIKTLIDA
ncbi:MAG: aminotransferase class V-fold PLP-dependent enzyme [Flammeovirgaceae bacterium]|nr:aminotransferase class V-fold PLP-dependent enzyme [Flammeovirgaceae bacterium]